MTEWSACPDCKKVGTLSRSTSRSAWERAINHSRISSIYRCHNCGWRGIRFQKSKIKIVTKKVLGYVILFLIIYYATSYFIQLNL